MLPKGLASNSAASIGSFSLDSTTDLPLKSWGFRLPEHALCCGLLQCQAWDPAEEEPLWVFDDSSLPPPLISIE